MFSHCQAYTLPLSLDLELFRWVLLHKVKELCSKLGLQPETYGFKYQLCLSGGVGLDSY